MRRIRTGPLTCEQERVRCELEKALFSLGTVLVELDEIGLRTQQAIRRTSLVADVLQPSSKRLDRIRRNVRAAQAAIGALWSEEETKRLIRPLPSMRMRPKLRRPLR